MVNGHLYLKAYEMLAFYKHHAGWTNLRAIHNANHVLVIHQSHKIVVIAGIAVKKTNWVDTIDTGAQLLYLSPV